MPARRRLLLLSCLLCVSCFAYTQSEPWACGQAEVHQQRLRQSENYQRQQQQAEAQIRQQLQQPAQQSGRTQYTLPVVFHIIHDGGEENIPDLQVLKALQYLNESFANTGYYDPATGVDVEIQFCLARRTPDQQPTTGIERVQSSLTEFNYDIDDQTVKDLSRFDPLHYINIWVVREICSTNGCSVAGYAYLPGAHGASFDGIVIEAEYTGSTASNSSVLTHELGHYLGLLHTFDGGCSNDDCTLDGDRVCDTPPDNTTAYVPCSEEQNSCTSDEDDTSAQNPFRPVALGGLGDQPDPHENYMDYSRLECFNQFSEGQAQRMRAVVETIRSSLLSSNACTDLCPNPMIAGFDIGVDTFFLGETLQPVNTSANAESYAWYINGELVSESEQLTYTFPELGQYEIQLEVASGDTLCLASAAFTTVTVVCPVQASVSPQSATIQPGETLLFSSASANATDLQWLINGAAAGSGDELEYTASAPGVFNVCLSADNGGCQAQSCALLQVIPSSDADSCASTFFMELGNPGQPDIVQTIVQGNEGQVYIAGSAGAEAVIAEVNPDGQLLWARAFDFTDQPDQVVSLQVDGEGMLFGSSLTRTGNQSGSVLFRYDAENDQLLWVDFVDELARYDQVAINPATGNYMAYGTITTFDPNQDNDAVLAAVDAATGNVLSYRKYDEGSSENFADIFFLGGVIYAGGRATIGINAEDMRATVALLSANGELVQSYYYLNSSSANARQYVTDLEPAANGMLFTYYGVVGSNNLGLAESGLVKIGLDGAPQWSKNYQLQGYSDLQLHGMRTTAGGYILYGFAGYWDQGDLVLIKTDEQGDVLWAKAYGGDAPLMFERFGGPRLIERDGFYYFVGQQRNKQQSVLFKVRNDGEFNGDVPCTALQPVTVTASSSNNPFTGSAGLSDEAWEYDAPSALNNPSVPIGWANTQPCEPSECLESCFFDFEVQLDTAYCEQGQLQLRLQLCNLEPEPFLSPLPLSVYNANPALGPANLLDTFLLHPQAIFTGQCDDFLLQLPLPDSSFYFVINDDGSNNTPFDLTESLADNITECDYLNNVDSLLFVPPIPSVDLGPDIEVCENSAVPLDAGPGFAEYRWPDGSDSPIFTAFEPGTYWVEVTTDCGLTARDTIEIVMTDPVSLSIDPPVAFICPEDTASVSLQGDEGYELQWTPEAGLGCIGCDTLLASPDTTTVYTVTATNDAGCISADSFLLNVIPCEQVLDTVACAADSLAYAGKYFYPGQSDTVQLSDGQTQLVRVATLDTVLQRLDTLICYGTTLSYGGMTLETGAEETFIFQAGNGCDSTVLLRVFERPFLTDTTRLTICEGDSALVLGQYRRLEGVYRQSFPASTGCDSLQVVILSVAENPQVSLPVLPLSCETGLGRLQPEIAGGTPPYTFLWSDGAQNEVNDALPPGEYSLTVSDANGCIGDATGRVLDEFPSLSYSVELDSASCADRADGQIGLNAAAGGTPPYFYSLGGQSFQSNNRFRNLPAGSYQLFVRDATGCLDSVSVELPGPPPIQLSLPADTSLELGDSLLLAADFSGPIDYFLWSPVSGVSCPVCPKTGIMPLETTRYQLVAGNSNGCEQGVSLTVFVEKPRSLYIPNAFSPNGDGVNERFWPFPGKGVERILGVQIFDRWGTLVYDSAQGGPVGWDGRFRGQAMQPAVFTYVVKALYIDGETRQFSGALHLLR